MPAALETLRRICNLEFEDEEGERGRVELEPALMEDEIAKLEDRLPGRLPEEIRHLLEHAAGIVLCGLELRFDGEAVGQQWIEGAAAGEQHHVMDDGAGNSWFVDVLPDGRWGNVFFACHDPPVMVLQNHSLAEFMEEIARMYRPSEGDTIDRSWNDAMVVWKDDIVHPTAKELRGAGDPDLSSFAETLPDEARVADLRTGMSGAGFRWNVFGPKSRVLRLGEELVFAVLPPDQEPSQKRGLLRRLFGR